MTFPKYRETRRLGRRYFCPCGREFDVNREIMSVDFAGLLQAQDDGSFRRAFRPRADSWLYVARYEDAVIAEESGQEPRRLPPGGPLPDYDSVASSCPACGRRLPPRECPDCGKPVSAEEREKVSGAEGDDEWEGSVLFVVCPAGHARAVMRRLDTRHGN